MLLQLLSQRSFVVKISDVKEVVRGTKKVQNGLLVISNKMVVDIVDAKAKKLIAGYPKEFEAWGSDAMPKKAVVKAKSAISRTSPK